ncbi:MAG: hypothetical protein N2167_11160 [Flavobacteriales bacterium]|nr:hypothetical protein [Flavobacteriales bacterium]
MKIIIIYLCLLFSLTFRINSQVIDEKIMNVYGTKQSDFFINNPDLYSFFENLLVNRIEYLYEPYQVGEKYPKLSTIPLNNKYNPALTRDENFDLNTFNPLKYQLNFYSKNIQVYRIDNTEYLLIIKPQ